MSKLIMQTVTTIGLCFGGVGTVHAELPKDVSTAYQTYETALNAKDFDAAQTAAYTAWQNAEMNLGDSKITGDLAQNFADISAFNKAPFSKTWKAYKRAIELAEFYPAEQAFNVRLDRTVSLSTISLKNDRLDLMRRDLKKLTRDAERADLPPSTVLAEAYFLQAASLNSSRSGKKMQTLGLKAVEIYEAADDGIASPFRGIARDLAALSPSDNYRLNSRVKYSGDLSACCTYTIGSGMNKTP